MSKAFLVAGLGFGDEGKGTITEYLVNREKAPLVVRYNGGPQAAHNVVLTSGVHHTFSQFGSGTFEGAKTFLSRFMLVDPLALHKEGKHLESLGFPSFQSVFIDRECPLVTPYHRVINRIKETVRGEGRHGSCGMGVGEAYVDHADFGGKVPLVGDLTDPVTLNKKLEFILEIQRDKIAKLEGSGIRAAYRYEGWDLDRSPLFFTDVYRGFDKLINIVDRDWLKTQFNDTIVFEGAQGVLLDMDYGFQPHTTWSNCRFDNAYELLDGFEGEITRVGVSRTYQTRHGAGPMPSQTDRQIEEPHNGNNYQGAFRTGHLDLVLMNYALDVLGGVDEIALTHMDKVDDQFEVIVSYDSDLWLTPSSTYEIQCKLTKELSELDKSGFHSLIPADAETLSDLVAELRPVTIWSWGPRLIDKVEP